MSGIEPGSTHDLAAARIHALPHPYQAARDGLPALAGIRYTGTGTGAGIRVPLRKHPGLPGDTGISNQTHNPLLRSLHFTTEHATTALTQHRRTPQHVTHSPNKTGAITQAALLLSNTWQ
ncbi:hypothetical protein ABZY03_33605 [Streptomyces klenkii]|uniref:hypothetical protein n=1 Tax=Streptomyces klenkii TaxID=1420899 RepID=UPI0033A7D1A7